MVKQVFENIGDCKTILSSNNSYYSIEIIPSTFILVVNQSQCFPKNENKFSYIFFMIHRIMLYCEEVLFQIFFILCKTNEKHLFRKSEAINYFLCKSTFAFCFYFLFFIEFQKIYCNLLFN